MKRVFKITGISILALILIVFSGVLYIVNFLPNTGYPPDLKVNATPERIARGKYLATCVTGCIDCHSSRDFSRYSGPLIEGTEGCGGKVFNIPEGRLVAPNITPAAIGGWTDGELYRAITTGVDALNKPLFPLMPYQSFGRMDREDIYDIIAYIRTLKPIHNTVERSRLNFPMSIIVHTIPTRVQPATRPPEDDSLAHGKYMVLAAGCAHCHSPKDKGKPIQGLEFSGGFRILLSNGKPVYTANITPDKETGIGNWSKAMFVARFKSSLDSGYAHPIVNNDAQTEMPWTCFANMKTTDLESIYTYLQSVKPVRHKVSPFADQR